MRYTIGHWFFRSEILSHSILAILTSEDCIILSFYQNFNLRALNLLNWLCGLFSAMMYLKSVLSHYSKNMHFPLMWNFDMKIFWRILVKENRLYLPKFTFGIKWGGVFDMEHKSDILIYWLFHPNISQIFFSFSLCCDGKSLSAIVILSTLYLLNSKS